MTNSTTKEGEENCCFKCYSSLDGCKNPSCPGCHKREEEPEMKFNMTTDEAFGVVQKLDPRSSDKAGVAYSGPPMFTGIPSDKDWRSRFHARFKHVYYDKSPDVIDLDYGDLESFIAEVAEEVRKDEAKFFEGEIPIIQRKAVREERIRIKAALVGMQRSEEAVGDAPGDNAVGSEQRAFGFNSAIDTALKVVEENI